MTVMNFEPVGRRKKRRPRIVPPEECPIILERRPKTAVPTKRPVVTVKKARKQRPKDQSRCGRVLRRR